VATSLLEPDGLWAWAQRRRGRPGWLAVTVAVALAGGLLVAVVTEIGVRHFDSNWNRVAGYTAQPDRTWGPMLTLWLMASALPLAQGLVGAWMLPLYGRARDWTGGLSVAVLGSVPLYLAAPALIVLPGILVLCAAYLVSLAWWGSGARSLLGIPVGESADHVVASIVAASVAVSFASVLVALP